MRERRPRRRRPTDVEQLLLLFTLLLGWLLLLDYLVGLWAHGLSGGRP